VDRPWYATFNWWLVAACILVTAAGVVFIHSADLHDAAAGGEFKKQIFYAILGIGLMLGVAFVDYHFWQRWALPIYIFTLVLLVVILKGGHAALGAQRWISLGPLGTFQPSEPAKFSIAIALAALLQRGSYTRLRDMLLPIGAVALPALLILKQPDLGTTLVVLAILTTELFFGLPKLSHFAVYVASVVAAGAFTVGTNFVLKPFQRSRLLVFLNPKADLQGAGYNLNQSKIAVGSGELFGKGLHRGTQTQLNFVPEHSRDFIFTVVGEEAGYVGSLGLLALYAIVIGSALYCVGAARDRFGQILGMGLVAMLAFHMIVNVGMTIGIMPITGIPLPFMSYGGSSILTNYLAVGVLINIGMQRDRVVFEG